MRKSIFFTILFGAALLLSTNFVQAQNAESYESLMKKGNDKFSTKDYISAKTGVEAKSQRPDGQKEVR